jgi:hypothetical protein
MSIFSLSLVRRRVLVGLLALTLLPAVNHARASEVPSEPVCNAEVNLLSNPSFESPIITNEDHWDVFPSPVDGWNVVWVDPTPAENKPEVANLEIQHGPFYTPADGDQFAELDSNWTGPGGVVNFPHPASTRIYQDINTIPGATYQLSFAFSPKPGYDSNDNKLDVVWGDTNVASLNADGSALTQTNWTNHSYTLVATSSVTRVSFADAGFPNSFGTFLDATNLTCTNMPGGNDEPTTPTVNITAAGGGRTIPGGQVLGDSTSTAPQPQVLGDSCGLYLLTYIKYGKKNDVEDVKRLQIFLNENMGSTLPISGFFGKMTMKTLKEFQVKYKNDVLTPWADYGLTQDEATNGTGYVYKTTQRWINHLKCEELNLPVPQLP